MKLGTGRKIMALAGFIVLGLSPSFVDWEQSPEKRSQIVFFYGGGLTLVYFGILQ
jgi:hypothetical protein